MVDFDKSSLKLKLCSGSPDEPNIFTCDTDQLWDQATVLQFRVLKLFLPNCYYYSRALNPVTDHLAPVLRSSLPVSIQVQLRHHSSGKKIIPFSTFFSKNKITSSNQNSVTGANLPANHTFFGLISTTVTKITEVS